MGFIRAGFTGGFFGIVISIAQIFVESRFLDKLSSVGLFLARFFGKACIGECGLLEKFTTILATIVGNTISYFVIFALISMAIGIIKMWLRPSPQSSTSVQPIIVQQAPPQVQEQTTTQQAVQHQVQEQSNVRQKKQSSKEKRPKKRAKVRKADN